MGKQVQILEMGPFWETWNDSNVLMCMLILSHLISGFYKLVENIACFKEENRKRQGERVKE